MKPASIRRFDLFFLGSLALSLVDYLIERSAVVASMDVARVETTAPRRTARTTFFLVIESSRFARARDAGHNATAAGFGFCFCVFPRQNRSVSERGLRVNRFGSYIV